MDMSSAGVGKERFLEGGKDVKNWLRIVVIFTLLLLAGCGDGVAVYPVTGKVTLPDDRPLVGATVTFKSVDRDVISRPRGQTDENGYYELKLDATHQGALPGKYQVTVTEAFGDDIDVRPKPTIHRRYSSFQKSGLEFVVEQGSNSIDIQVDAL